MGKFKLKVNNTEQKGSFTEIFNSRKEAEKWLEEEKLED
jgi:hypothetical protein